MKSMLVLASQSPRRSEILRQAGFEFRVEPAHVDETIRRGEAPEDYARRMAELKARSISADANDIVLGADTVVVIDGAILGKPSDTDDARRMLRALSGRKHEVITGICLKFPGEIVRDWGVTQVWFVPLSNREIVDYIASGEPIDKAGAYAIQGLASKFVERIDGGYFNVMGLPVSLVYRHLKGRLK